MPRAVALRRGRKGLVSKKSKTGDPACSAAMSAWKTTGMTPAIAAVLGKCRSKARHQKMADSHRAAGNEARAQASERRADRGLTLAERAARAKELRAKRAAPKPARRPIAPRSERPGYDRRNEVDRALGRDAGDSRREAAVRLRHRRETERQKTPQALGERRSAEAAQLRAYRRRALADQRNRLPGSAVTYEYRSGLGTRGGERLPGRPDVGRTEAYRELVKGRSKPAAPAPEPITRPAREPDEAEFRKQRAAWLRSMLNRHRRAPENDQLADKLAAESVYRSGRPRNRSIYVQRSRAARA